MRAAITRALGTAGRASWARDRCDQIAGGWLAADPASPGTARSPLRCQDRDLCLPGGGRAVQGPAGGRSAAGALRSTQRAARARRAAQRSPAAPQRSRRPRPLGPHPAGACCPSAPPAPETPPSASRPPLPPAAWEKRWKKSSWKQKDGSAGEFKLTAGKWFGGKEEDAKGIQVSARGGWGPATTLRRGQITSDRGARARAARPACRVLQTADAFAAPHPLPQTGPDSKYFAIYSELKKSYTNDKKDLVVQVRAPCDHMRAACTLAWLHGAVGLSAAPMRRHARPVLNPCGPMHLPGAPCCMPQGRLHAAGGYIKLLPRVAPADPSRVSSAPPPPPLRTPSSP